MNRRHFLKHGTLGASALGLGPAFAGGAFPLEAGPGEPQQNPSNTSADNGMSSPDIRLDNTVVMSRPGKPPFAEQTATRVLIEEVEKRTAIRLGSSTKWVEDKPVIAVTSGREAMEWGIRVPARHGGNLPETRPEGYRLLVDHGKQQPVVWVIGADARGALFGVGNLLRRLNASRGKLAIAADLDIATAPVYAIRGHQLGYRATTNTYDAWSADQFEQYIRELTFFGVNSIEGIPFQDDRETPVMKVPRPEMNRTIGEICQRYGLDYWAWVPADFSLEDQVRRAQMLKRCEEFFNSTPVFTGFTFPGGDPGSNPPELVLPFLEDIARLLIRAHPEAKVWLSLQHFNATQIDYTFNYIQQHLPPWLGGLVAGPGSPPMGGVRNRLPDRYGLRDYPDITHNKLCQYEVPDWDQAYALTEGRESINPRPAGYTAIFSQTAGYTNGFISYSEGVNDDVNKTIWSALSWDPHRAPREILVEYARVYFKSSVAERAADAILALENNWRGPLIDNGAVEGALMEWQQLATMAPDLEQNWRWQMCQLRANYDAYLRRRLVSETRLESEANAILANSEKVGADKSMEEATRVLNRAVIHPVGVELRARISALCDELFHSIGLQTSVQKYFASGEERGAVLDFVDYPLNNRWWLEDQFKIIRALDSEDEKHRRLLQIATWEHPGPGSFYDDLGNIAKSPHVDRCNPAGGPELEEHPTPTFWWWDQGKSRARLSWQVTLWPTAVVYDGLDPNADYVIRSTGYGQALLRINGERVEPTVNGTGMGQFKEFPVAPRLLKNRKLVLTWDRPLNEEKLNWRRQFRIAEVWLLKNPGA
ncbi:MAG TPA: twin-arginine translocation signal domain-containing protein [Terriglobia bacterium]|nr:twin-arginine translocation signal domain-containing protein [Terriglobia bacterium]